MMRKVRLVSYPYSLKRGFEEEAAMIEQPNRPILLRFGMQYCNVVLTHLSEKNNSPYLAESTVLYYIGDLFVETSVYLARWPKMTHYIGKDIGKETVNTVEKPVQD